MKYLKSYKIYERHDIENDKKINDIIHIIIELITNHINDCIIKYKNIEDFLLNVKKMKYENITIDITSGSNISFAKDMEDNLYLFLGFDTFDNIINDIAYKIDRGEKIKPLKNLYNDLDTWERMALTHELTHKVDNEIYDMFDYMKKRYFNTIDTKTPNKNDIENAYKKYINDYNNIPAEYNAIFVSTLNKLIKDIKNDNSILNNFEKFKNEWEKNIDIHNPNFYNNTKFKKNIQKRLYDAYIKLKKEYNK